MIGPTGVGKTEIARRLAKPDAPFIKVEATNLLKLVMWVEMLNKLLEICLKYQ